jgi:hypothetical protein
MNVSVTPKLIALVKEHVRAARLKELRREIAVGLRQLDHGRSVAFDRDLADAIKAEGRKAFARQRRRRA